MTAAFLWGLVAVFIANIAIRCGIDAFHLLGTGVLLHRIVAAVGAAIIGGIVLTALEQRR